MGEKSILHTLSEFIESLEEIRGVVSEMCEATEIFDVQARMSDEEVAKLDLTYAEVEQQEAEPTKYSTEEREALKALIDGCDTIEWEATKMIRICLDFKPML